MHTGALISYAHQFFFWTLRYSYIVCTHTQGPSSSPWKRVARHPRKVHRQAAELKRTDCEIFKIWSLINTQTHFLLLLSYWVGIHDLEEWYNSDLMVLIWAKQRLLINPKFNYPNFFSVSHFLSSRCLTSFFHSSVLGCPYCNLILASSLTYI